MKPLDGLETYELLRLRKGNLRVPAGAFSSEREELTALRASLEQELAELRALTAKDWPLSYAVGRLEELQWRRPLAEQKRAADTAAKQHAEALARRMAQAHTELTAVERREALRKNWAAHEDYFEEPESPIYSCPGDCGRKHLSSSAASACSNIRRGVSALDSTTMPARHAAVARKPGPPPGSGSQAVPAARKPGPEPRRQASDPLSATTTRPPSATSAGRPALPAGPPARSAPAAGPALLVAPSRSGSRAAGTAWEPVPHRLGTSPRRAEILDAVRSNSTPMSANRIAVAVGGRKATVLEEVRAMVQDGLLVVTDDGLVVR